jgi:hypothetical protein
VGQAQGARCHGIRVYSGGDGDRGNITCNTTPLPTPQHATDDQAFLDSWESPPPHTQHTTDEWHDSLKSPPPCAPAPTATPFYTPMVPNTPLSDELDMLLKVCTWPGSRGAGVGFARCCTGPCMGWWGWVRTALHWVMGGWGCT